MRLLYGLELEALIDPSLMGLMKGFYLFPFLLLGS